MIACIGRLKNKLYAREQKKVYTAYTQNPFSPTTIYNKEKKRLYNNNTHGTEEEESETEEKDQNYDDAEDSGNGESQN